MTLSLNPTLTQNKEKNTEIQAANTDLVTQHKPMPQQEAPNTGNMPTQEPIEQTQDTTQSFDINNKAYQDFIKAKLAAQKGAEVLNDKFSNNDYIQGAYRAVKESAKSFNPLDEETKERYNKGNSGDALWEAWNTITGQTALRNYNKEKLKEKEAQQAVYSYLEKYGTSKESIGLKNYEEDKLKEQKLIKGIQNKEIKDLSEEEKDYLRDSESNISRFIDYLFTDENKNLQKYKNNLTRQNINHELVKKLVILDSQNSSIFNLTEDLQKEARQKTLASGTKLAQMYGYDRLEYDKDAQDYVLIDKEGNKLYPDMQSVFNNLGTALEANYYDVVSSFIPVGKALQVGKGSVKLTQSLAKTALQSAGMSAIASPLDYINMQNETAQEGDIQDIIKHSAGNALGSAAGVMAIGTLAKGAGKAYNSIKDLKNLSTDDLKNIKISKYLDNEEASIHRKLAKFNKSEIDSNYEIFKNLQSDRVISKEMKDPTFMGNFMDKISDYNVLKHLSSKKESQDKLLSALFSNKELAREFAGKLTSEEATIVNKAIHAMGENFTRLSKEYEQQIIDEYAKSGKIKGLNPHTESSIQTNKDSVMLSGSETSHLNETKDVFTFSKSQNDNIESKSIQEVINIIETSPQKERDMQIIGEANFTPQAVEYAHKNNKKIAIDKLDEAEAQRLGFKHPQDVRVTIDSSAINHTLNRHGVESDLVKQSGQKPVEYSDIANYRNITKTADETLNSVDNMGTPVIVSYKQVNGHFVAVEEIRKKQNELSFKTMFKQEGNYKDSESYKKTSQNSNATEGYEPTANSFALTKKGYKPDLPTPNETIPQTKPYEVNENGRKYIEIPDDELADFEKSIKQALLLEPRQQELLKKINADSKDIDSYAEFMTNERKIMKGHEFTFNQQQEGLADRFLNMANSLENPRDRNHYAENILANMKHDIEKLYKSNASEFLAREAEKPFYKQMDKIRKETDEIVEALNKERDRLHAEKETQLKAQQEAEKATEIERIANYDLETAYKEKAHLEKIMQSNRNDYSPYSFSPAHNSEFLDKLDLVEQRIRDLKNKLPNKTPQENKPSKVEALKDFMDNARFQVDYAIKAGGTDTALKLIQQMIKDTNNTYEAKFLYRLKKEIAALKGTESNTQINKDISTFSTTQHYDENKAKDMLESSKNRQGGEMIAIYTHKQMPIHTLREELKTILKPIVNMPITNQNDKRVAVLSNKAIAKMYSTTSIQKSVKNGFTQEEHFIAAQNIKELFENAKLLESTSDRSGDTSLTIHRYMVDLNVNNKNAQAKITIKETLKDGNRIYTMELMEPSRSSD